MLLKKDKNEEKIRSSYDTRFACKKRTNPVAKGEKGVKNPDFCVTFIDETLMRKKIYK